MQNVLRSLATLLSDPQEKNSTDTPPASWWTQCGEERGMTHGIKGDWLRFTALICTALLVPGDLPLLAQQPASEGGADAPKARPADQLDSLVAPIALYPDPLLAQVLAASTYPLEVVQAQRWL